LIIQKRTSNAFFSPETRFKNNQGLLSLIRLAPKFVVLNLTVKMEMRPSVQQRKPLLALIYIVLA
jgi:hypothetical protein